MEEKASQCAFPADANTMTDAGMTLREYFAAKVLNGIYANNEMWVNMCIDRRNCTRDKENDTHEDYVAQQCYKMADAMLKESYIKTNKS